MRRNQVHQRLTAAIATADATLMASLSYRVAMRRQSLRRQKARSIRFHAAQATASCGTRVLRERVEGITASVAVRARRLRKVLASYPVTARSRTGGGNLSRSAGAAQMSARSPGGQDKGDCTPATLFQGVDLGVKPPRVRPIP